MSNLIIVESGNDKYFIEAFIDKLNLKSIEVDEPICNIYEFKCLGGIEKKLEKKLRDIKFDEYNNIGIILDADKEGIKNRIVYINEALKIICGDIELNNINQFQKSKRFDVQIACYIMNVEGKGELETLQRAVVSKDSTYADCLEGWRDCLKSKDITIEDKEFDKVWVSNYLKYDTCIIKKHQNSKDKYCTNQLINNSENRDGIENNLKVNAFTIKKDIWNFEHTLLDELKIFLKLFSHNSTPVV